MNSPLKLWWVCRGAAVMRYQGHSYQRSCSRTVQKDLAPPSHLSLLPHTALCTIHRFTFRMLTSTRCTQHTVFSYSDLTLPLFPGYTGKCWKKNRAATKKSVIYRSQIIIINSRIHDWVSKLFQSDHLSQIKKILFTLNNNNSHLIISEQICFSLGLVHSRKIRRFHWTHYQNLRWSRDTVTVLLPVTILLIIITTWFSRKVFSFNKDGDVHLRTPKHTCKEH